MTAQAQDDDAELWAVLYLHDWDPPTDGKQPIYPEIHGVFSTWQEAEAEAKSKLSPERYYVRRAKNFTHAARLSATTPDTTVLEACATCDGKGVYDSYDGDGRAFEFECYTCHGTGRAALSSTANPTGAPE